MPKRRFNIDDINLIRSMSINKISYSNIINVFNTSKSVIYSIINRKTYKNIPFYLKDTSVYNYLLPKPRKDKIIELYPKIVIDKNVNIYGSGVYIIRNKINNKCYVGSSNKIKSRLSNHLLYLIKGNHPNNYLRSAFNKYGQENFEFIPILNCPTEYNKKMEQWVKDKSGFVCSYNLSEDCEFSGKGHKVSDESKMILREKALLRGKMDEMVCTNLSNIKKHKVKNEKGYKEKLIANLPKNVSGINNPNCKLSDNQVIEIINRLNNNETPSKFFNVYPCSRNMIYEIKAKRAWKNFSHLLNN